MADHGCNKVRTRNMGVDSRGLAKYNMGVRMLKERYLKR